MESDVLAVAATGLVGGFGRGLFGGDFDIVDKALAGVDDDFVIRRRP